MLQCCVGELRRGVFETVVSSSSGGSVVVAVGVGVVVEVCSTC